MTKLFKLGFHYLRVIDFGYEILPHCWSDLDLNCIVTSGDRFDVPFHRSILKDTFKVVNIWDKEETDKDAHASDKKSFNLSVDKFLVIYCAWDLNEKIWLLQAIVD